MPGACFPHVATAAVVTVGVFLGGFEQFSCGFWHDVLVSSSVWYFE